MALQINPALDRAALAAGFAARGRVRIPDVLTPASAERLHRCLSRETPWKLCYNDGADVCVVERAQVAAFPPPRQQALQQGIAARARDGFQFLYYAYPMLAAYQEGRDPGLFLHQVLEFLNAPEMLDLVRQVTALPGILKGDAQATMYGPGHFLTRHDDQGEGKEHRRVAYVLNMTRGWKPDWGGLLQFYGPGGDVEEGWVPGYNTLALFRVPVLHAVTYVTPFAGGPRLSITGWWRDG